MHIGFGVGGWVRGLIVGAVALGCTTPAMAQCVDWASGFGTPGLGIDGTVYALERFDPDGAGPAATQLFAGGIFQNAGGVPANGLARWTGQGWAAVPGSPSGIKAMKVFDDGSGPALYVAGQFIEAGGAPGNAIARWDGSAWSSLGSGLSNNAGALAVFDDGSGPALYVGGDFVSAGGAPTDRLASWNGSQWRVFSSGPSARLDQAMAYDSARGRTVVFGGRPTAGGGVLGDTWTFDGSAWTRASTTGPAPRYDSVMVYDSLRQRIVLVGGRGGVPNFTDTWIWDGSAWSQVMGAGNVPARTGARGVYDAARDRVVLFGGQEVVLGAALNDTLEFDGSTWQLASVAASPTPRSMFGMSYDGVRQRVVLFGGYSPTAAISGDTWEYDGIQWQQRATTGPTPRDRPAMVFDGARGTTLLFGGNPGGSFVNDTWSWDGAAWMLVQPHNASMPDRNGPMVYDAARQIVLQRTGLGQSWAWNGSQWSQLLGGGVNDSVFALAGLGSGASGELFVGGSFTQAGGAGNNRVARLTAAGWLSAPELLQQPVYALAAFDSGSGPEMYAAGGFTLGSIPAAIAKWNGTQWTAVGGGLNGGGAHCLSAFDDGSGPVLMVGGYFDEAGPNHEGHAVQGLAAWTGSQWKVPGKTSPAGRSASAAAYDPVRRRTVLFGGTSNNGAVGGDLADTWEFDGQNWEAVASSGPPARFQHAMSFDPVHARCIVAGGRTASGVLRGDTWAWDGAQWALSAASIGGDVRAEHAVAFDSLRGRLVLFGGVNGAGSTVGETWEWDGSAWQQIPVSGPPARRAHAMAYDAFRSRLVLFGGMNAAGQKLDDVWEYDGSAWSQRIPVGVGIPSRSSHTMVYDSARRRVVVLAGQETQSLSDMQEWNGTAWSVRSASLQRHGHVSAYDSYLDRHMAFGGRFQNSTFRDSHLTGESGWGPAFPGAGLGGTVRALSGHNGVLFVGGTFESGGGKPAKNISVWNVACSGPAILQQPTNRTAIVGQETTFSVAADGSFPLGYQWRRNGVPLVDGANVDGSRRSVLRLNYWSLSDAGTYDVLVRNPHGETVSQGATLTVPILGTAVASVIPILVPPQAVPGLPAANQYTDVLHAVAARTGEAVMLGTISGPIGNAIRSLNVWLGNELRVLHKAGDPAPGLPTGVFLGAASSGANAFSSWRAGANGAAAFTSPIWGTGVTSSNNLAHWHAAGGQTRLIARKGGAVDGQAAGVKFSTVSLASLGDNVSAAIFGTLTGGPYNPAVDSGIWRWTPGAGQELIARTLTPAPGTAAQFVTLHPEPLINSQGRVALMGTLNSTTGFNYSGATDTGVWIGQPGSMVPAFRSGDAAPGMPPSSNLEALINHQLNNVGDVAMSTYVAGPSQFRKRAVYKWTGGSLVPLLFEGQAAPGSVGGTFVYPIIELINDAGDVVVSSIIQMPPSCPSPCGTSGLWLSRGAMLHKIAMTQELAPGVPTGTRFSSVGDRVALNDAAQVVLETTLYGTVSGAGIYGWSVGSGLFPIAVPGQQIETGPGSFHTVFDAHLAPIAGGGSSGFRNSRNITDSGQVVLEIRFSDPVGGVFSGQFGEFAGSFFTCPAVIAQPRGAAPTTGQTLSLEVEAVGTGPLGYQWRRDGVNLVNGGRISGATSPSLTITNVVMADSGLYDVVVSNTCGSATSLAASVSIVCYANCDGSTIQPVLNINDFVCFLNRFNTADLYANCDGSTIPPVLNVNDFVCFLSRYAVGCP